ncbi:hypothetical protein VTN00DRAFT_7546 [Thermoascus crustaceus]|uniref:uncharacterized protein n=1 Tax=Thermoascus crustaceus TaxID=5088 RepID=UPI0037432E0F
MFVVILGRHHDKTTWRYTVGAVTSDLGHVMALLSVKLRTNFKPESVNAPRNAIILVTSLHEDFGNFDIALEETQTEDVYQAKCYNPQYQAEKELDIAARRKRPWPAAIGTSGSTRSMW